MKKLLEKIHIDLDTGAPAYLQILSQIQALIAGGELLPGHQLPTVRLLAAQSGINFNTVARAYRLLDKAGLITTQQGRGTYVRAAGLERPQETERLREAILVDLTANFLSEMQRMRFPIETVTHAFQNQVDRLKGGEPGGSA